MCLGDCGRWDETIIKKMMSAVAQSFVHTSRPVPYSFTKSCLVMTTPWVVSAMM